MATPEREDPFSVLPVEACCQVLCFLPAPTVALCCLWREICNDESLWRTLYLRSVRQDGLHERASKSKPDSGITWKQMCLNLALSFGKSKIVEDNELRHTLIQWVGAREARWVLHYRGSRDGFSLEAFHRFNDCVGPTLCVAHSENDSIFGGYNAVSWITLHQESDDTIDSVYRTHTIDEDADQQVEEEEGEDDDDLHEESADDDLDDKQDTSDDNDDRAHDSTDNNEAMEVEPTSSNSEKVKGRGSGAAARPAAEAPKEEADDESEEKRAKREAKMETLRAKRARMARDARLTAEKHLPTDPFIFSLKNVWDKPPTQIFPRRQGDKNGVLVHGYYGALWGSGFDLGIIGHPNESPPSAWCRIGTTYAPPYPSDETGGSPHCFLGGDPRDFPITELEVFVLKEEEDEWQRQQRLHKTGLTRNAFTATTS